jgi:hypothetical protein
MLPGLGGISGYGSLKPTTLTFQANNDLGGNNTVYSFSSQPFGTASSDRVVIVHVSSLQASGTGHTLVSATIGGVNASIIVQQNSGKLTGAIIAAVVPTGSTGTITFTFSVTVSSVGYGIWSATGLSAASAVNTGSNTDLSSLSLNNEPGGFVIAGCTHEVDAASPVASWSGATEAYDSQFETDTHYSGASDIVLNPSVIVQPTITGSPSLTILVAATF